MKRDAKFEGRLALGCKTNMRNLVNLMRTVASQHLHFDVALLFSMAAYKVSAKKVQHNYLS